MKQVEALQLEHSVNREIQHASKMRHANVVHLKDVFQDRESLFLVLELVKGKDLFDVIVDAGRLPESRACVYFIQMLTALEFMHSQGLCHRDLKPENILVDQYDCVKISDFGFCTTVRSLGGTKFIGSVQYMAPEMCDEGNATNGGGGGGGGEQGAGNAGAGETGGFGLARRGAYDGQLVDIWSAGVVLYVMVTGKYPFEQEDEPLNDEMTWENIKQGRFTIPSELSAECRDLLAGMLRVDPKERLNLMQIRYHPFILSAAK